jgi:DNA mismatch endonuclease, patch repair protein
MDTISKERRSWNMSRIRGRDTAPEILVRSALHHLGYRFRLHRRGLPGCPDIILPHLRTAIFVHGCFWHRHRRCKFAYTPKTRPEFWQMKFAQNIARDQRAKRKLNRLGWHVLVIWECQTGDGWKLPRRLQQKLARAQPEESNLL